MDDLTQLKVDIDGYIASLTMNSPPVNALTRILNDELTLALDRISETDDIRVVVLTGAGKVFCAGADLKGRAEIIKGRRRPARRIRVARASAFMRSASAPSRSSWRSTAPALGSGLAMVASADVLIASEKAVTRVAGGRRRPARRLPTRDATLQPLPAAAHDADRLSRRRAPSCTGSASSKHARPRRS